jgi:hypothetical protein
MENGDFFVCSALTGAGFATVCASAESVVQNHAKTALTIRVGFFMGRRMPRKLVPILEL